MFLKDVSGGLPWANAGHYSRKSLYDGLVSLGYQASYFTPRLFGLFQARPESRHGWRGRELLTFFVRHNFDVFPLLNWRLIAEQCITGNVRGIGRLGAYTWLAVKDKRGRRRGRVYQRFPGGDWGYLNCNSSALAPGPEGPVGTVRFEVLREGVQECEALILLERVLLDDDLKARAGPELVARAEQVLAGRRAAVLKAANPTDRARLPVVSAQGTAWFLKSGWRERSSTLYTLAGELQKKLDQR